MTTQPILRRCALSPSAVLALLLISAPSVWAQSSGNFAAGVMTTQCTINKDASLGVVGSLDNHNGGTLLSTTIQTPNSSQTALVITPSLVTGLYTNTQVTGSLQSSAQDAAVVVSVTLDGKPVLPETADAPYVIYDERFQELSTNVFDHIEDCANNDTCYLDLALSTLSAHSFNFVAPSVGGGNHKLEVKWEFQCHSGTDGSLSPSACTTTFAPNTAGACAGPGTVTVQQVKTFSQSGGIKIQ